MLKARYLLILLAFGLLVPTGASAQTSVRDLPDLPALSPAAETYQRAGITDLRITYSSPARRDRVIWGGLVPYSEMWRAGANAPTRLSVSEDFSFGGTDVPAGEYSLFILPEEGSWTFVLNTDSSGRGVFEHDEAEDVARATITPTEGPDRERMHFVFTDTTNDGAVLTLEWAGLQGGVPIAIDTPAIALEAINANIESLWRPHFNAARYYLDAGLDLEQAEAWMARSIEIEATWWNHWFMARILAGQEEYAGAREHVARAMELGAGQDTWESVFMPQAEEALASWPE